MKPVRMIGKGKAIALEDVQEGDAVYLAQTPGQRQKKVDLEKQVTSLQNSKALFRLGYEMSIFSWSQYGQVGTLSADWEVIRGWGKESIYPAFTVAELGYLLPHYFQSHRVVGQPESWECSDALDREEYKHKEGESIFSDSEANVRAKMLIYLVENRML